MKEKLTEIITHYGVRHQLKKLSEEVFELQEAVIEQKGKDYKHITEEVADVCVLLAQLIAYYKIEDETIINIMEKKVERQIERMKI